MGKRVSVLPYVLITIGFIFLLGSLGIVTDAWWRLWPLLLIVIGVVKVIEAF
jgi:fatty acid desaturase